MTPILSRRDLFPMLFTIFGTSWPQFAARGAPPRARAKSVIFLFNQGGPSHLDTFDPKPDAPAEVRGPVGIAKTAVPGLYLSEYFPLLTKWGKELILLRSLHSLESEHERAIRVLRTSKLPDDSADWPTLGGVLAKYGPVRADGLPGNVALNPAASSVIPGGGFFGPEFDPHVVTTESPLANMQPPDGVMAEQFGRRMRVVSSLDAGFATRTDPTSVADHVTAVRRGVRFAGGAARAAFDLSQEPLRVRDAYGETPFGQGCLLARRLVERGVRFVEVTHNGWDAHKKNFEKVEELAGPLDLGFSALLNDLKARGLLDQTLVVCMGEFGRTPVINREAGRDHWSQAFCAALAGGGLTGGRSIGSTDARGEEIRERPIGIPNLFASILHAMGVDVNEQHTTPDKRPVYLTEEIENGLTKPAEIVRELFE